MKNKKKQLLNTAYNKAFKFRFYPDSEQIVLLDHYFGSARFVYNQTLNHSVHHYASIQHGYEVFKHPEPVKYLGISIGILCFSVLLEGYALYGALKGVREENSEWSLREWFKETRNSELLIVVAEDTGALVGLAIALTALTATAITGNPIYDAIGTIMVGVLLIVVAINVMIEVKAMITGESIGGEKEDEIIEFLEKQPEVDHVINIITQQYGKDIMVAVKVHMKKAGSNVDLVRNIDSVEDRMQKKFNIKWSFFEPDIEKN